MSSQSRDEITTAFQQLIWLPDKNKVESHIRTIETYVISVFVPGMMTNDYNLDEIRYHMYTTSASDNLREPPPIQRCTYDACVEKCIPSWMGMGQHDFCPESTISIRMGMDCANRTRTITNQMDYSGSR